MITILHEQSETVCARARAEGDNLWIEQDELQAVIGWTLKPEGFCQGDICVPVPPARASEFMSGTAVNGARLWSHLGKAVTQDKAGTVWVLGASASERQAALQSLEAPNFSLPDLAGAMHTLHAHRGQKALLVTWASW